MAPLTTPEAQDNILLRMAAHLIYQQPDARPRILRALHLVGLGHVRQDVWGSGEWQVRSADRSHDYTVRAGQCDCPDSTNRARRCKHVWSTELFTAWEHEARFQMLSTRQPCTANALRKVA